ncbi:MAG TPA: ATP-binding protein [Thermoplasmata archaeon]|jgi:uncharacterized protein (TIGR00290 family)|nr:ATP-binding protein [Thermoplasmata archaeon]
MRARTVLSWSSGKDSAWSLLELRRRPELEVVGLLTTVTRAFDRVAMHGVREALLERQASACGLPLLKVEIPSPCPNAVYEQAMRAAIDRLTSDGVSQMAFGDLYLTEIREYREAKLRGTGITPIFPLWGRPTAELARAMIDGGLEATAVCVDPAKLPASFAGRRFDRSFLADLPAGVDPCGENGEFHTFVSGGPMFDRPIGIAAGPVVERDGFVFADLVPA